MPDAFTEFVYPGIETGCVAEVAALAARKGLPLSAAWAEFFRSRAILAPYNDDVEAINRALLAKFPGDVTAYYSNDSVNVDQDVGFAPTELLHTISVPGLPSHELRLKPNAVIMLMRNLSPARGLCNGTRLRVLEVIARGRVLKATIISGSTQHLNTTVLLPRITIQADKSELGFAWSRTQFPVKLAFAMTLHKSQGQTLSRVGLWLERPCFAHGQLYVALSRVGDSANLQICAVPDKDDGNFYTDNVVWSEALTNAS